MARKITKRRVASAGTVDPVPETGGQSGDTQGLSGRPLADSESVRELVEEGQYFEAAFVDAIENAPDPDVSEVVTHEVPEDDIPPEYREHERENRR